ncbi:MAG: class I SAM-dependent methyltransferase [Paenibacillus sp.]|uniref:class I SAM-dependent methyltransferase n=1 Tax=Paenibacillus sp. TaxID=58172 RepID=UPI00291588EF|nr:class I SAM-dependent methyltransferase [Paenibacillus sp.]MDU4697815.1 class I SAM-dependent methyltransferase [Paenibacillus sp.]
MNIEKPFYDYDKHGTNYAGYRRTDPRIERRVLEALSSAQTILNVGSGTGSYEPKDRYVVAVEPSAVMRAQRLTRRAVPAVNAWAEALPFDDEAFDAGMAMVTLHHWTDYRKGLQELRRVTRGNVVVLTFDPEALDSFWNAEYFPELVEAERRRYPKPEEVLQALGGSGQILPVPVPFDCIDGFQEAFYGRPEAFLVPEVRQAQSAWGFLEAGVEERLLCKLSDALKSGEWDRKYGNYRTMPTLSGALRLIVSQRCGGVVANLGRKTDDTDAAFRQVRRCRNNPDT